MMTAAKIDPRMRKIKIDAAMVSDLVVGVAMTRPVINFRNAEFVLSCAPSQSNQYRER
jgi:hypothetical protein